MKRLLIILIVVLFSIPAMAQLPLPPYVRSGTLVQPQDYRLQTLLSFKMPVAQDTTLNGSVDSTGMMILRLIDTSVYVRVPSISGINKWIKLLKLGEGGGGSYVTSFNTRTGSVTLTSLDVTTALGYAPVNPSTTLTINGVAQDLSTNRSWTVGDVLQSGSYSNPSWITSLAWSKITGAPTIGSGTVTSFSAGDLSPLFTTTETNPTTTPALAFALSNAAANSWFGNASGTSGAPSYNIAGAITKTDDTNVTLTLGGTPAGAALKAVSLALGWNGQLPVRRGGTGLDTITAGGIIYGSAPGVYSILSPGTNGYILEMVAGVPTWQAKSGTGGITSLNGLTASTQTFSLGSGVLGWSSVGSTHTINIPNANDTTKGLLPASDWITFNNKLSNITGYISQGTNVTITGSGTSGDPYVINSSGSTPSYVSSASIINVGDTTFQRAALTGDVASSQNSNSTTISNNAVTFAKFQNVSSGILLGRYSPSSGLVQQITLGANLTLSSEGVLSATGGGGGGGSTGGGSFIASF